jgi:hypothetical protein
MQHFLETYRGLGKPAACYSLPKEFSRSFSRVFFLGGGGIGQGSDDMLAAIVGPDSRRWQTLYIHTIEGNI